jgi:hydrogenase-4 component E
MTLEAAVESVLAFVVVANLILLGSSRLKSCIRVVAAEGIAVGLLPILFENFALGARALLISLVIIILKGVVFPHLMFRILRDTDTRREVEPFVGYPLSLAFGAATLPFSIWVASRLELATETETTALAIAVGLATLLVGLFVIVSRKKAVNQVLGYIVMENGIYVFGVALVGQVPMLVELGVLLDAFVAVFIMSIAAYQISREFEHIDVDQLDTLKG